MIQDELDLAIRFEAGQTVWWTHGLSYLVATYMKGGKIRPESKELVRIEAVDVETQLYSGHGMSNRTISVYSFKDERSYSVHPRWLSISESAHCDAVLEAYGRWGN